MKDETIVLHHGHRRDESTTSVTVPIYQTTSYQFNSTDHASKLFSLQELGNIYSRIMNPTCAVLEERMTKLDGGACWYGFKFRSSCISFLYSKYLSFG